MGPPLIKLREGTQLQVGSHRTTIIKFLSEGGFANIYKVRMDPPENDSDIACLKRVIVPDKSGLILLRKEVDVMKALRHGRDIVKYYDSHAERLPDGTYHVMVLMELCPNGSLLDFMNERIKTKLTEPEILKIMLNICLGVYEMHRLKLIHRDIKIENVLIDSKGNFKLCDFGSTSSPLMPPKDQQEFQALSHDILYQTTPQYRAPEMIDLYRGFPIDEKSDIWALGCFLYKLCYYTTPFEANGDIAILHASFQFLPNPVFSGDLKNLIIIMLQENPLFRPNIVQVIMIVFKLINKDYKEYGVKDFYEVGPYNFQALSEYQKMKQNELLKQQQMYYQQQQQQQLQQHQQPLAPSQVTEPPAEPKSRVNSDHLSRVLSEHASAERTPEPVTKTGSLSKSRASADIMDSINSQTDYTRSSTEIVNEPSAEHQEEIDDFDESFSALDNLDNVEERYPSLENILVSPGKPASKVKNDSIPIPNFEVEPPVDPVKPAVLGSPELKKLNPEQLNHYNYQHQVYQREYHSYQQYQQQQKEKTHSAPNFESKDYWKKLYSSIDKSAEKLADDIFGSGTKSPEQLSQPQKTSQSSKSEQSVGSFKSAQSTEDLTLKLYHSQAKLDDPVVDILVKSLQPEISNEEIDFSDSSSDEVDEDLTKFGEIPTKVSTNYETSTKGPGGLRPNVHNSSRIYSSTPTVPVASLDVLPVKPHAQNPFPYQAQVNSYTQEKSKNPERKYANPWGEYTHKTTSTSMSQSMSQPGSMDAVPTILSKTANSIHGTHLADHFSSLSVNEIPKYSEQVTTKAPEVIEPNLIDLEVGLDSSSGTGTPITTPSLQAKVRHKKLEKEPPLLDLDESKHFKKRISSLQNPSRLSFQEEVIDFASDDENPENGSKMSRLSIRNSLRKPKSRKPSEHKRSESSNSESKKRLSFFGGSTT